MADLTSKELSALGDQLSQEQVLVKKYRMYAQQMTDAQLKAKCEQIAAEHQNHYNTLMSYLN